MRRRLVIYTETYGVGGAERFVVDVLNNIDLDKYECILAGNSDTAFADYLKTRLERPVERHLLAVRAGDPRLLRLGRQVGNSRRGMTDSLGEGPVATVATQWLPLSLENRRYAGMLLRTGADYWRIPLHLARLQNLFERLQPDILHINNGGYPAARSCQVAPVAARRVGVRRIISFVHGYPTVRKPFISADRRIDRLVSRNTDLWLTAGRGCAAALVDVRDVPRAKIRTVRLGQDLLPEPDQVERASMLSFLRLDQNLPTAFLVGGLNANKGQGLAIEAISLLQRNELPAQLVLVGEGIDRPKLERQIRLNGLGSTVKLLGFRKDVNDLLAGCDVLLNASTETELLPYAIKEAMARGLPVVATTVGGIAELVTDNETGILVPPNSAAAIAGALARLFVDSSLRSTLGRAGRLAIGADYSMRQMMATLYGAYEGAI